MSGFIKKIIFWMVRNQYETINGELITYKKLFGEKIIISRRRIFR